MTLAPPKKSKFGPPGIYSNLDAVNDELIELLLEPSEDEGAMRVFQR